MKSESQLWTCFELNERVSIAVTSTKAGFAKGARCPLASPHIGECEHVQMPHTNTWIRSQCGCGTNWASDAETVLDDPTCNGKS